MRVSLVKCDCATTVAGVVVHGTAPGMDVHEGIQYCQDCEVVEDDLAAAEALAAPLGGAAAYYQYDDTVAVDAYDEPAEEARLVVRVVGVEDGLGPPLIHGHTNPWVQHNGLRFDWYTRTFRPLAELRDHYTG